MNSIENINIAKKSYPKVSVIVPAYNTEKFVNKCLLSLVNQTLKDLEIIVINDGSTDNTENIVSSIAQNDRRVKIVNQMNLRQGAARNNGIKVACGEYIGFVDSDDWVDLDFFEKLYCAAKKYDSDIALATNVRIGNGKTKKRLNINKEEFVTNLQDKMDVCHQWKDGCPTNKIYKNEFLKKFKILYPEGVFCEDKIFTVKSVFYANGIVTVPNTYYYYFRNPDSTVNSKKGKHNELKKIDRENARREVLDFLKSNKADIRDKDFWAIKRDFKILGMPIYRIKESLHTERHFLFSLIPVYEHSEGKENA